MFALLSGQKNIFFYSYDLRFVNLFFRVFISVYITEFNKIYYKEGVIIEQSFCIYKINVKSIISERFNGIVRNVLT